MSIVLVSSGGGQITLLEPTTASNFTQTLPAATGSVALTSDVIGVNQTWTNTSASRSLSVTFTNSTGKPIMVSVIATRINTTTLTAVVAGITVAVEAGTGASANAFTTLCFIVPNGATYSVSNAGGSTLGFWAELR